MNVSREHNYWLRATTGRMTRRRFVGGAIVGGVGAASLATVGCGGGDDDSGGSTGAAAATTTPAPTTAPVTIKKGGVYNVAFTGPFAGVDPHNSVYGGSGIVPVVYNYLLRRQVTPDAAGAKGIIYDVASSHKVEADSITYTFKLRDDVKIAPNTRGVPERALDADDVKASFDRISDPKTAANGFAFFGRWVDKYTAPDKTTFVLTLKKPYAWTEANLGNNLIGAIVPKEWLASADIKKDAVGAGPFMLKTLTEGQLAQMDRNPNYYIKGQPYVDSKVIKAYADQATYRTAFTSNQIDVYGPQNKDETAELKSADKTIVTYSDPGVGYNSFWMNTKQKPWDDPRVRRAVNLSMNRKEYIDIIGHGVGEPIGPLTYAFTKEALTAAELAAAQPYDPTTAKKLFADAGITELKFTHPTSSNMIDYVNIFTRHLAAVGVTAKPDPQDAGTWVAGYFTSKLAASYSLNQAYQNPDFALQWYHTGGITGNNAYDNGWAYPEIDAALDKAAGLADEAARVAAYKQVQKDILAKDPAFINVFGQRVEVVVKSYVKNYPAGLSSLGYQFEKEVWLDKA
jgi:ABC-type transport system substrate-binding protein